MLNLCYAPSSVLVELYIYINIKGPVQPHTKRLETFSVVARSGVWSLSCYDRLTLQEAAVEGSPSDAIDGIITRQRSAIATSRAPHDVGVLTVIREVGRAGSGMSSDGTGSWRDIPAF